MDSIQELEKSYHFDLYRRLPVTLVKGKGVSVWDSNGKKYVDFLSVIAVNALGHCHPEMVKTIRKQSLKLIHVAFQSDCSSSPIDQIAGSLHSDSAPSRSHDFTFQKHCCLECRGAPAKRILTVSPLSTLPLSQRSPWSAASLSPLLATRMR